MITESIINFVLGLINNLLIPIDLVEYAVNLTKIDAIKEFLSMVVYIIPLSQLMPILYTQLVIIGYMLAMKIIRVIIEVIPFA